jgi:hypothetical protein
MALKVRRDSVDRTDDGGHGLIVGCSERQKRASVRPANLIARRAQSGQPMPTAPLWLTAYPLLAAVAFAHFGVPDGYVGPHDSPAAYAQAVEAARAIARP